MKKKLFSLLTALVLCLLCAVPAFAEMPLEEKNVISHRRRGIEALLHALEEEE